MASTLRRGDRAISDSEALELIRQGEYGVLSTVSPAGQPYGVPVSFAYAQEVIYFHCAPNGHKLDNLSGNNRVSFCVVGPTELLPAEFGTRYASAIVFGTALEVWGDEKRLGLLELVKKYSAAFVEKGQQVIETDQGKTRVYKIVIETITGKSRK